MFEFYQSLMTIKIAPVYVLLAFSFLVAGLNGCSKDEPGGGGGPDIPLSFPLVVGHTWKYYTSSETYNSNGSLNNKVEYFHYWKVEKDTQMFGVKAVKISFSDSAFNGRQMTGAAYYTQTKTGLYMLASLDGNTNFGLNKTMDMPFSLTEIKRGYTKGDELSIPDSALYILKYPVKINEAWSSSDPYFETWRQYVSNEIVTTPAGIFPCSKVKEWVTGTPADQVFYRYYSPKGLIQRTEDWKLQDGTGWTGRLVIKTQLISTNF
jgi:hypothetical protein